MKKTLKSAICVLISAILIAIMPTENDAAIYNDTIRLHIIAPTNSSEDQNLKFMIRDKVLEKYSQALSDSESRDDAEKRAAELLTMIETDCNVWLSEAGSDLIANVSLSDEWYGTREYGDFSMPCGEYLSLKIVIGEGEGENWWCVMYPPLCLDVCVKETDALSDTEKELISENGYTVKFKLLEVVSLLIDNNN